MTDCASVAEQLRRAGPDDAAIAELFAPMVMLSHEPPSEGDGPVDGSRLAALARAEAEAISRALPPGATRDVEVTTEGRYVHSRTRIRATLPDGTTLSYEIAVRLEVEDSGIVGLHAHLPSETLAQHGRLLALGGFSLPEGA